MAKKSSSKGKGCLSLIAGVFLIAIALLIYSYAWIPAIGFLIYFCIKKDFDGRKKIKIIISSAVLITSLITFIWLNSKSDLEDISVSWSKSTYDINDTIVLDVSPYPTDAEISTLSISDNSIADMVYENGKATITFKSLGTSDIYFIANDTVTSNTTTITVIDEAAEEQKRLEEEARKAEEERLAAEQKAEEERLAAEQAAAEQAAQEQAADPIVYITNTGDSYHRAGCRHLKSQIETTLSAVVGNYTPCGTCNPPTP